MWTPLMENSFSSQLQYLQVLCQMENSCGKAQSSWNQVQNFQEQCQLATGGFQFEPKETTQPNVQDLDKYSIYNIRKLTFLNISCMTYFNQWDINFYPYIDYPMDLIAFRKIQKAYASSIGYCYQNLQCIPKSPSYKLILIKEEPRSSNALKALDTFSQGSVLSVSI